MSNLHAYCREVRLYSLSYSARSINTMGGTKLGPYRRARKETWPIAKIILRVRKYFEQEKKLQRSLMLTTVFERISEVTGFSRRVVGKVKSQEDFGNWKFDHEDSIP